jgi:hypothetical protein
MTLFKIFHYISNVIRADCFLEYVCVCILIVHSSERHLFDNAIQYVSLCYPLPAASCLLYVVVTFVLLLFTLQFRYFFTFNCVPYYCIAPVNNLYCTNYVIVCYTLLSAVFVVYWSEFLATDPEVRVRFPALPDFLRSSGPGTGFTQPREYN